MAHTRVLEVAHAVIVPVLAHSGRRHGRGGGGGRHRRDSGGPPVPHSRGVALEADDGVVGAHADVEGAPGPRERPVPFREVSVDDGDVVAAGFGVELIETDFNVVSGGGADDVVAVDVVFVPVTGRKGAEGLGA